MNQLIFEKILNDRNIIFMGFGEDGKNPEQRTL
jgi:hypothetical protein